MALDGKSRKKLLGTRSILVAAIDELLPDAPEWQALKSLDGLLLEDSGDIEISPPAGQLRILPRPPTVMVASRAKTYSELAGDLLDRLKRPATTQEVIDYIAPKRGMTDPKKAKINITSAMSHDPRFKSYEWKSGTAWWWADKPVPQTEAADLLG